MNRHIFGDYTYSPIAPCADNEEMAALAPRLMYRHRKNYDSGVEVFMAPKHELTAGWVIGLMNNE